MLTWLRDRGLFLLCVIFLLVFLGLTLLAALGNWGLRGLIPLSVAALASAGAFTLAMLRLARVPQRNWGREVREREIEFEQAREQVYHLIGELRRSTDELTTRRDQSEFLRQSLTDLTNSLQPRQVLDNILARAIHVTGARWGSILLLDEQGHLRDKFLCRTDGGGTRLESILSQGLAGWVVTSRQGALLFDTAQDPRWLAFPEDDEPTRSAVAVPFLRRDRALGVMVLTHPVPFQFSEGHLTLLQELAQQAAVCLENADLYTAAETERQELSAILDGTTDIVIALDAGGKILLLNRAAERAFHAIAPDVSGLTLDQGIPHATLNALFAQALERQEAVNGELTTPAGRVHYCSVSPVKGVGWVAIMQDITYLKELDRMKNEFVATVSHDLRSPLTSVRGYADLLPLLGPVTPQQQEAVTKIRRAALRMNDLITDLLDLGKVEAGIDMAKEPCALEEIVREAAEASEGSAREKGLELAVEIEAGLPPVLGNTGRLRQVAANLVDNAVKYTPAGGRVSVSLGRQGTALLLRVSDTGIGIAPEDQRQLFQKFYRVQTPETENIPGTGLGLAIVRSIVEQHGGQIGVQSAAGQGSTFSVTLPAAA